MRASEFSKESEVVQEIERLSPSGFSGGKEYLDSYGREKTIRKLPGGSGLLYSITNDGYDFIIKLWDPANKGEFVPATVNTVRPPYYTRQEWQRRLERINQREAQRKASFDSAPGKLIGQLTLHLPYDFPMKNALQVGTITVDEDYRGVGLAKALYGIVLTIMKRPLVSGDSQTPGGRRNWVSLSQIPGVEMKGYFSVDKDDLEEKIIDTIMGKLGGQYIGTNKDNVYFAFDVKPTTTGKELEAFVKTNLTQVYDDYDSFTGLYAIWTGQT